MDMNSVFEDLMSKKTIVNTSEKHDKLWLDDFSFNLRFTKKELEYLYEIIEKKYKYSCRTYSFVREPSDDSGDIFYKIHQAGEMNHERNEKMHILLTLMVKLQNKHSELG